MAFYQAIVHDAQGLGDKPFLEAQAEGKLDELLDTLPVAQKAEGFNLVTDSWVSSQLYRLFSGVGAPSPAGNMSEGSLTVQGTLGVVALLTTAAEPDYEEWAQNTNTFHNITDTVSSSYGVKRVWSDRSEEPTRYSDLNRPVQREAIVFRGRWMWLPSEGDLTNIRSVSLNWKEDADSTSTSGIYTVRVARMRFKKGGVPINLTKNSNQSFLLEVFFSFVTR